MHVWQFKKNVNRIVKNFKLFIGMSVLILINNVTFTTFKKLVE